MVDRVPHRRSDGLRVCALHRQLSSGSTKSEQKKIGDLYNKTFCLDGLDLKTKIEISCLVSQIQNFLLNLFQRCRRPPIPRRHPTSRSWTGLRRCRPPSRPSWQTPPTSSSAWEPQRTAWSLPASLPSCRNLFSLSTSSQLRYRRLLLVSLFFC